MQLAFVTFLVAGLSDAVDGFLAKRFSWQTELGAYLDPIADKALLVSIYVALGFYEYLPAWLVILVVSRDILIIGAILLSGMINRPVQMHPLPISKVNTAGQIILAALVLFDLSFGLNMTNLTTVIVWLVGLLTVASATAYLVTWFHHMAAYETKIQPSHQQLHQQSKVEQRDLGQNRRV